MQISTLQHQATTLQVTVLVVFHEPEQSMGHVPQITYLNLGSLTRNRNAKEIYNSRISCVGDARIVVATLLQKHFPKNNQLSILIQTSLLYLGFFADKEMWHVLNEYNKETDKLANEPFSNPEGALRLWIQNQNETTTFPSAP